MTRTTRPPSSNGVNIGIGGSAVAMSRNHDEWPVNLVLLVLYMANGTVCGSMEGLDVPREEGTMISFWTGEIIDNVNNVFRTRR